MIWMNDLQVFENVEFGQIRTVMVDSEPWFVATDVCKALGIANSPHAVSRLEDDEKNTIVLNDSIGNPEKTIVNEYGLYNLILTSRKPEAKKFKRWVTHEVLPSIRKTGGYQVESAKPAVPFKEQVECVGVIADMLRVNDAGKINMLTALYDEYQLPRHYLPKYELNGNRDLKSATELLKRFALPMSVKVFNSRMAVLGMLEERTRNSSKEPGKQKKYKALTETGLCYGENAISPHNVREVQPMYYVDSFKELYEKIAQ